MSITPPTFLSHKLPKTEVRVVALGIASMVYGVLFGGLFSLYTFHYALRGARLSIYDLGTGLTALLALGAVFQIATGVGLILHQAWAVRTSYGVAIGLLIVSGLGFTMNVVLDNPYVPLPIAPFFWAIVLNFVLRSSKLAKSLKTPRQ